MTIDMGRAMRFLGLAAVAASMLAACEKQPSSVAGGSIPGSSATSGAYPVEAWPNFALGTSGFMVMVPSAPKCLENAGENGMKFMACSAQTAETGVVMTVSTLPAAVAPDKVASFLERTVKGASARMKRDVADLRDIEVGGSKGKDYTIKGPDGDIRNRMVIRGDVLVQVMASPKHGDSAITRAQSEAIVSSLAPATIDRAGSQGAQAGAAGGR